MARRRSKRKQQATPENVGGLTLLLLSFLSLATGAYWLLILIVLILAAYVFFKLRQVKARRVRTLALADLRSLSHRDLELHVAAVLDALPGWKAQATRGSSDQGADVIATSPSGVIMAVQVKHYPSNNVGNKAVQEIVASKAIYRASEAVVFTSGPGYTASALELARANQVRLWTPAELFSLQASAQAGGVLKCHLLPA